MCKKKFWTFFFFAVNFKQIHTRNKKKKFENKMPHWLKRCLEKIFFFTAVFWSPFLLVANNFCWIWNHILIGLYVLKPVVKNQGGLKGDFFELFGLKSFKSAFSWNCCAVNITTAVWPPPSPGHERADGRTLAGRSALIFKWILVICFLMYL